MRQLGKRLISSAVFLGVALSFLFFAPRWLFTLLIQVFIFIALSEYLGLVEKKGIAVFKKVALGIGVVMPYAMIYGWDGMAISLIILGFFVLYFRKDKCREGFIGITMTFFGVIYVAWCFSHMVLMRELSSGAWWIFYTILIIKIGDSAAYFVGKSIGNNKLIEHISPNKSIEGAIAGFLATVIVSVLSALYLPAIDIQHLVVLGLLVAVMAQLADLGESLLKRDVDIKDSGEVPGLGGFLDVLDSLLIPVPFVYYYLKFFAGIV